MRNTRTFVFTFVLGAALAAIPSFAASGCKEAAPGLQRAAKVTCAEATKTALAAVAGGKIQSSELEMENGLLVYSFDIRPPAGTGIDEVQVDAKTGKIVSRQHETPADEQREQKAH